MEFVGHDELVQFLRTFKKLTGLTFRGLERITGVPNSTLLGTMNRDRQMDMPTYEKLVMFFQSLGRGGDAGSS